VKKWANGRVMVVELSVVGGVGLGGLVFHGRKNPEFWKIRDHIFRA
jgi:hypothetical protein